MEKLSEFMSLNLDDSLKAYQRKLYNEFVKDKELLDEAHAAGFTNQEILDNIGSFTDLKESRDLSKKVNSYKDCIKYNHFYEFKFIKDGKEIKKEFYANKYYQKYLDYMGHFYFKDFSDEFNDVNWRDLDNVPVKKAIGKALKNNKWVYLRGAIRSGRTYLAIGITNEYIKKNKSCNIAFIDAIKRFEELKNIYYNDFNDFENLMDHLINIEFLVIDNFGSESKDLTVRDKILLPLLSKRAESKNITIFTTNSDRNKICKMYELRAKDPAGNITANQIKEILANKVGAEINVSDVSLY